MQIKKDAARILARVRKEVPLVHNITNYVTVNDCANAVLAIGASPIMADDIREVADITAISASLVINIGTLNQRTVESMLKAGKKANELGIPVVFDPVGAGASVFRNETTKAILEQLHISILRGNLSEISYVAGQEVNTKGVDVSAVDAHKDGVAIAKSVAKRFHCVAAVTGPVDMISDGDRVAKIANGHSMLSRVTGTGCMTSALVASFAAAAGKDYYAAAVGAVAAMGIAGEIAYEKAGKSGTGSYRTSIMDALYHMEAETLEGRIQIEEE
jgi:hydroxyethylthiazole kinase